MKKNFFRILACAGLSCITLPAWAADLMEVYQQGVQSDPIYQAAVSTRLSTREIIPQSLAALLPNLSGVADTTGNRTSTDDPLGPNVLVGTQHYNSKGYTVTLTQPVFNFAAWYGLRGAKHTAKQADATLANSAQNLILRVAQDYFNVLLAEDNLRFALAEKAAYASQLHQAKERFSVGVNAITDVYNAQASYDSSVANVIASQNTLRNNQEALRQITGRVYPELEGLKIDVPLNPPVPNDMEQWVASSEKNNTNLLSYVYAMETAREQIKINKSGHLPTVSVVGTYSRASTGADNGPGQTDDRAIGLQLSMPIFSGGLVNSQVRQAKDNFQTADENRENAYRQATVSTRQYYNNVISGISQIQADQATILSSQSSLESTQESYKVGTRTIVDVLNAEQTLYQSKSTYASDVYNYIINTLQLKYYAGTLGPNDLAEINQWLHGPDRRNPKYSSSELHTILKSSDDENTDDQTTEKPVKSVRKTHHHKKKLVHKKSSTQTTT